MRPTRKYLAIALTAMGVLGVLWAVYAQEIALPPPILQPDPPAPPEKPAEKKAPAKHPFLPPPMGDKSKGDKPKTDPTLIIPPDVFDVPHVLQAAPAGRAGIFLTEGGIPPPSFPGSMPVVVPASMPPTAPPDSRPLVVPAIPPPPEPTKMLIDPLASDPPLPGKNLPEVRPTLAFPPPPADVPNKATDRTKSFVRLQTASHNAMPPPLDVAPASGPGVVGPLPLGVPPPQYAPNPGALLNLQTPAVAVEKRGQASLRPGETQTYQIVIRNLGSVPAQQVRIEEEIPAGARLVFAEPQPHRQGSKAIWIMALAPGSEQTVRLSLQADAALQLGPTTSVQVGAMQPISTTTLSPPSAAAAAPTVHFDGPAHAMVGKPVTFEVHVANQSGLPLTGVKMFGYLPDGLNTPQGREIEMASAVTIAPGGFKVLKMPVSAVAPGRHSVRVKIVSSAGEAWANTTIDIAAASLTVHQAEMTRLYLGRESELRIEVANGTGKTLRNLQVASLLPEGIEFLGASDRGLFQANHRTVYWHIDPMPAGQTRTLTVRVSGAKPGQYQNVVSVRADGVGEIRSSGAIAFEGMASLNLRVIERDNPLEIGKDTIYEIQINNTGGAPAHNVRLAVEFPQGLIPRNAEGHTRQAVSSTPLARGVAFEPIPSLAPDGQAAVYRVSAHAQSAGDQRVRFAIVSDEVQTPLQREISTKVY